MKNIFTFFCLFFFSQVGFTQYQETFDMTLNGWQVNDANYNWYFSQEGTALSHNWNNRPPIDSDTNNALSGTAVFNGDSLSAAGATPGIFMLTSEIQGNPIFEKPILSFRQYFKNYQGIAHVDISIDNGNTWTEFPVNQNYGDFMETPKNDKVYIDVSSAFPDNFEFQIRFVYEGVGAFWIIDDVRIDNITDLATPGDGNLSYPETYPAQLADKLCQYEYPFLTDSEGGAYIPDEWVVLYTDDATEEDKDTVRMIYQITEWESCNCSDIELWKSPIVIEPVKIDLPNSDFPINANSIPLAFPDGFTEQTNCQFDSYLFDSTIPIFCESNTFNEHTSNGVNSEMLIMRGVNSGFSIPSIILEEDSLYLFSFFARNAGTDTPVNAEIFVGDDIYQAITIDSEDTWQRFDIKLDIPIGGSGIIEFRQTTDAVIVYAIDDLCISHYMLGESDAIGLTGIGDKTKSCVSAQELDKNYYNFDLLEQNPPTIPVFNNQAPNTTFTGYTNELVIAVLDSGIDYQNDTINDYIYYNQENVCYPDANFGPDYYGYDFVDKDSRPYDAHWGGHGTHVASTIIQNMTEIDSASCTYKILPVRTHDEKGIATLFNVTCGISYASERGADYINASWGYYAEESPVLSEIINQVKDDNDVMIVCSAGNDTTDIGIKRAFPSSFDRKNLITVAASDTDNSAPSLALFSNRNDDLVHYATQGVDIAASVPPHAVGKGVKDGTSMAAPRILAATAMTECNCGASDGRKELRSILNFIDSLNQINVLSTVTRKGRFIDIDDFQTQLTAAQCRKITGTTDTPKPFEDLTVFPNPASNEIFIITEGLNNDLLEYKIINVSGQTLRQGELRQNYQSIFLNGLQKGIYFLQVKGQQGIRTISFIKS